MGKRKVEVSFTCNCCKGKWVIFDGVWDSAKKSKKYIVEGKVVCDNCYREVG